MHSHFPTTLPLAFAAFLVIVPGTRADEYDDLKQTVQSRAGAIRALKASGAAREDAGGFLAGEGAIAADEQRLLDGENADRRRLFDLIAQRTHSTPAEVAA